MSENSFKINEIAVVSYRVALECPYCEAVRVLRFPHDYEEKMTCVKCGGHYIIYMGQQPKIVGHTAAIKGDVKEVLNRG